MKFVYIYRVGTRKLFEAYRVQPELLDLNGAWPVGPVTQRGSQGEMHLLDHLANGRWI